MALNNELHMTKTTQAGLPECAWVQTPQPAE